MNSEQEFGRHLKQSIHLKSINISVDKYSAERIAISSRDDGIKSYDGHTSPGVRRVE